MRLPLEEIFKSAEKRKPVISYDGRNIAYIKTENTQEIIVVRNLETQEEIQVCELEDAHIMELEWLYNNNTLYYVKDIDGNENFRLYTVDVHSKKVTAHTPFEMVYVKEIELNNNYPDTLCFSMNKDNPQAHDAYTLNIKTGDLTKVFSNDGKIIQYLFRDLVVGAYTRQSSNGNLVIFAKEGNAWRPIYSWGIDAFFFNRMIKFSENQEGIYLLDAQDNDTTSLVSVDVKSGQVSVVVSDPNYDIDHVVLSPDQQNIEAVGIIKYRNEYKCLSSKVDYDELSNLVNGEYNVVSQSQDGIKILQVIDLAGRVSYALYKNKTLTHLFSEVPELDAYELNDIEPIRFKSRDGLTIEGYMTYPKEKKEDLPLVINVHGGPWGRDMPLYIAKESMWFSSIGYASMNINFRGSTGYGTKFFGAGRHQWGKKMQEDLIDGMQWAVNQKISKEDNVSIFGMSYGGYAVLAAATLQPDIFCCGVDRVGPSDVVRILEDMPPQWGVYRKAFYHNVGDPVKHREMLLGVSPLHHVEKIKMPLLVAQGKNDPRVKVSESEDIVRAMKEKGLPYEYILFEDEGHIFVKDKNMYEFYNRAEAFLNLHHRK